MATNLRFVLRRVSQTMTLVTLLFVFAAVPTGAFAQASKFYTGANAESTVSRLSDAEVRELLLQRLQKEGGGSQTAETESFNPAVFAYRLQRDMGRIAEELDGIFGSVAQLPAVFPRAWEQFSADRQSGGLA